MENKLEKIEYNISYVVYSRQDKEDWDWANVFDTKKAATDFALKTFSDPKIRVCASIDAQLGGNEFAYGNTLPEALKNLKAQVKEYGYMPYDPWKE